MQLRNSYAAIGPEQQKMIWANQKILFDFVTISGIFYNSYQIFQPQANKVIIVS
jgi:hypothetical protein